MKPPPIATLASSEQQTIMVNIKQKSLDFKSESGGNV